MPPGAGGVPSCLTCGLPPGHLSVTVRQWLVLRIRSFPELEPTSGVFAPKMVCGIEPQKIGVAEEEEELANGRASEASPTHTTDPFIELCLGCWGAYFFIRLSCSIFSSSAGGA